MSETSYPNITLNTTTVQNSSGQVVLGPHHNGATITSTLGSSVNLVVPANIPAGFLCWAIQYGAGAIGVTAGSGATANNVSGFTGTSGQYGSIRIHAVTDGNVIFSGDAS